MSITVKNVTKFYGEQKALSDLSFSIEKGEIIGFLGPNGAGKSTLMKILTGYIKDYDGDVLINGDNVHIHTKKIQQIIGYLPEHNPLYTEMYVREYLAFNSQVYHISREKIEEVIQLTGLQAEANKKIDQLSKGYRQRVGLANALLHDPEILILDEPTTGLDPNQLLQIRELIKKVGKEKTIFLSTHIMQEVEAICDRVIIIKKGNKVADIQLEELHHQKNQIIEVEFDYRVEKELFDQLPHLTKIENTGGFVYLLDFSSQENMRPYLINFAKQNGLKVIQLHHKQKNLEKIFIELTS